MDEPERHGHEYNERKIIVKLEPVMKMLIIIISSSHSPAIADNSATPRASPPADKVPNPLLNPLLRVAPIHVHCV